MTIWLLIMMLHGEPHIIDHYGTLEVCQQHIKRGLECVEGTVIRGSGL